MPRDICDGIAADLGDAPNAAQWVTWLLSMTEQLPLVYTCQSRSADRGRR